MSDVPTITQDELVERIKTKLESRPHIPSYSHFSVAPAPTEPAAYVLILGAGFSYGIVPLVGELMQQTIGDYYYPDQDQWGKRPERVLRKDSARFWAEFNRAAAEEKLPIVELDGNGLPKNAGAAYQNLFTYERADALFALSKPKKKTYLERLQQLREDRQSNSEQRRQKSNTGERFVKGFLRYVLDPGAEHGFGSTGRSELNKAHIYLAALLEAQQLGRGWETCAFCRTIFTTNFDTLLQNALQRVNLLYRLTDRPERGFDHSDFHVEEGPIHLVYVHGSILRHNPASTIDELSGLAGKNIEVLRDYLKSHDVIAVGYSGWNDGLMAALRSCDSTQNTLYWCDINSQPSPHVTSLLSGRAGGAVYVHLGEGGSDDLMRALYEKLIPAEVRRIPIQGY
jgi:SIR2-like domain